MTPAKPSVDVSAYNGDHTGSYTPGKNGETFRPARESLIRGYRKNRALTDEHLSWLPVMFMARAVTYLGWIHTRSGTETAREMAPCFIDRATRMAEKYLRS